MNPRKALLVLLLAGCLTLGGLTGSSRRARAGDPIYPQTVSAGFEFADDRGIRTEHQTIAVNRASLHPGGHARADWVRGVFRFFLPERPREPAGRLAAGTSGTGEQGARIRLGSLLFIDSEGHLLVRLTSSISIEMGPDLDRIDFGDPIRDLSDVLPTLSFSTSFRFE